MTIDWTTVYSELIGAARAARSQMPFDSVSRDRVVAARVAEAGAFSYLPVVAGIIAAVVLPLGWIWLTLSLVAFAFTIRRARQRRVATEAEQQIETANLRAVHADGARAFEQTLAKADRGEADAVRVLLSRWIDKADKSLDGFAIDIMKQPDGSFAVGGRGVDRIDVPDTTPRVGRGGRTFYDKRKATDIDTDLTERNAGAVIAALSAIFAGQSEARVAVRITIADGYGRRIPWVTLATVLNGQRLARTLAQSTRPSDVMRQLGGSVGGCTNQRYAPAAEPSWDTSADRPMQSSNASTHGTGAVPLPPATLTPAAFPDRMRANGRRVETPLAAMAAVSFGMQPRGPGRSQAVPLAPLRSQPVVTISVSVTGLGGDFAAEADKRVAIIGDPHASFVPFQSYWSTYAHMNAEQAKFYFRWRSAVRARQFIATDMSYIFIHVYELLHLIGATQATDATDQLTRLWQGYRTTFPKLDNYLVPWITDLYATEVDTDSALNFLKRHVDSHTPQSDDLLLTVDPRWADGDYSAMTPSGLAMLLVERRLGENKFVREHNIELEGVPWVEGAYRAAIRAADDAYRLNAGRSPREVTIKRSGQRMVSRPAFASAVYSWKRKEVKLAKVPKLTESSPSVVLYRSVTRHAENLLREERGFRGRLRGVELAPEISLAVEACIETYARATKPRVRVNIDASRAEQLAQESAGTRARLLQGLSADSDDLPHSPVVEPRADGLLTDVDAVAAVMHQLTAPAEALIIALLGAGWESLESDDSLIAATGGVLVGPLVEEVNGRAIELLGHALVVREAQHLIIQEDYRDEVFFVVRGNLDGFSPAIASAGTSAPVSHPPPALQSFGPVELQTLLAIASGVDRVQATLSALAVAHASTPLMLVDRLNECAVDSTYGDILVDSDTNPPTIFPDAQEFVAFILDHIRGTDGEIA